MSFSRLEKRINALETFIAGLRLHKGQGRQSLELTNYGTASGFGELDEMAQAVKVIKERAEIAGEYRIALACVHELCRIVELRAKLGGELDERNATNILNVNFDPETAARMAQIYLQRRELESK